MEQLRNPLLVPEDGADVVVVVVQSPTGPHPPALHTLTPAHTAAAAASMHKASKRSVSGAMCDTCEPCSSLKQQWSKSSMSDVSDGGACDVSRGACDKGRVSHGACDTLSPHTLRQWRAQGPFMWLWLMCSLLMMLMGGPIWVQAPWVQLVATLAAAAVGVLGALLHCFGGRLAQSGALSLPLQVDLVAACATAAACIDLLAMVMYIAWMWAALYTQTPTAAAQHTGGLVNPGFVSLLLVACCCWQHGIASVAVLMMVGGLQQQQQQQGDEPCC